MRLIFIPNILKRAEREMHQVEHVPGRTLAEYFEQVVGLDPAQHVPIVSGKVVEWDTVPEPRDELVFTNDLKGGKGGFLSMIFSAIMIVVGVITQQYWLTAAGVSMLVGSVVGFLTGMFSTPKQDGFDNSQTYSWDGIQNIIGEGNIVPVVYGEHRMGGVLIEGFVDGDTSDGVQKSTYLNVLCALSEGPIESIDRNRVFINNKEVSLFEGVTLDTRLGGLGQTPMSNFSKIARHYSVTGVQLKKNSPYIYKTNNEVHAARISLMFAALFRTNDEGDIRSLECSFRLEYAPHGSGIYTTVGDYTASNNSKTQVNFDLRVNFPSRGIWNVRITRLSDDWTGDTQRNGDSYLKSVTEYENGAIAYVNTALLGLRIKATDRLSGAVPTITSLVKGRVIKDVRTNLAAFSKNPANILYDLLTNTRFGLGRVITPSHIDLASFQEFADWCDEIVPFTFYDGATGTYQQGQEKRYELNLVLDKEFSALDLVSKVCNTCRALPYWEGDKLKVVVERPSEPTQLFTMGNIVEDSFEETYIGLPDIPNQVEAHFLDEENDFRRATVTAFDQSRIDETVNSKSIQLYGLTRKSRVKRELVFALRKARSLRKSIRFQAGIEAVVCQAGDVILFQHDTPQYGYGGRIDAIPQPGRIMLDRAVPVVQGVHYTLRIRRADGTFLVETLVAEITGDINVLKVSDTSNIHTGDLYAFGELGIEAKPYRVTGVRRTEGNKVELQAIEYNAAIFTEDESIVVEETHYSQLGLTQRFELDGTVEEPQPVRLADNPSTGASYYDIPPYVTDINLRERVEYISGQVLSHIIVDFAQVFMSDNSLAKVDRYDILHSTDGENWTVEGSARGEVFEIRAVERGIKHYILVKPVTNYGVTNDIENGPNRLRWDIIPTGEVPIPSDVSNFVAVQNGTTLMFQWDAVVNTAVLEYEVRQDDWLFGKRVGKTRDTTLLLSVTATGTVRYFIKAKNVNGVYSANAAEMEITIRDGQDRNILFSFDEKDHNWDGARHGFSRQPLDNTLVMDRGRNAAHYISGYMDLGEAVQSRVVLDCAVTASVGNETRWDDALFIWDGEGGEAIWESLLDADVLDFTHDVTTFLELPGTAVDAIRLCGTTGSLKGVTPTIVGPAPVFGEGSLHKGLERTDGTRLSYALNFPAQYSLFFRHRLRGEVADGTLLELRDAAGSRVWLLMHACGDFWLWDGERVITLTLTLGSEDDLFLGVSTTDTPGFLRFFAYNATTGQLASGTGELSLGTPNTLIL